MQTILVDNWYTFGMCQPDRAHADCNIMILINS